MTLHVRPATAAEFPRIPAFLPRWQTAPEDECVVVEASSPARIVGMAALSQPREHNGKLIAHLDASVLPRFSHEKLSGRLVAPLIERASVLGCDEIRLISPRREDSPDYAEFQALGFAPFQTLVVYEFSVPAFAQRTRLAYEGLVRRKTIPAGAKIVELTPNHWAAVSRLALSEQLVDQALLKRVQQKGLRNYFSPISRVLLLDDEVVGILLVIGNGRRAETVALAVVPGLRGRVGWANALLNYHGGANASALGYESFLMQSDPERHPMTTYLARRMGATLVRKELYLQKFLT